MKEKYLSTASFVKGRLLNILERRFGFRMPLRPELPDTYTFVKELNEFADTEFSNWVGLYTLDNGKKVSVRSLAYRFKNLKYRQVINETHILTLLESLAHRRAARSVVTFPRIYTMEDKNRRLLLVREYVEGKQLRNCTKEEIVEAIDTCIREFNDLSHYLTLAERAELPKRGPENMVLLMPLYIFQAVLRDYKNAGKYLKAGVTFFHYLRFASFINREYILAHRDLHTDNVLKQKDTIKIIDPEICVLSETMTDLAIIARFYFEAIGIEGMIRFLQSHITSNREAYDFIRISLFYALQVLVREPKNDTYYIQAQAFVDCLFSDIIPALIPRVGISKKIYDMVLSIVGTLPQKAAHGKKIVLCYHSISQDRWLYSVSPAYFEHHMKYLNELGAADSLTNLLKETTSSPSLKVAVTFDDGYEDVYTVAYPIMKKYGITGTLFLIADSTKTDRHQLDTHKPLLTKQQIRELLSAGWEIGSHSMTHTDFASMSTLKAEYEIKHSKKILEDRFEQTVPYFAYPKGVYTQALIDTVQKAGYTHGFSVDGGYVSDNTSVFTINRVMPDSTITPQRFRALLSETGIRFATSFMAVISNKDRRSL